MPLLIDCYNLLHADMPPQLAGLDERGLNVALHGSGLARAGVTVVCDGSPKPHSPTPDETGEVRFIYSGPGRSADSVIIERIRQSTAPRRLTVVTDDREIIVAARRRRTRVMGVTAFVKKLDARLRSRPSSPARGSDKPQHPLTKDQVATWMRQFGYENEDTTEERPWWEPWEHESGEP